MAADRRTTPRINETAAGLWQRWIRLSAVRRAIAAVASATLCSGLWFTACAAVRSTGASRTADGGQRVTEVNASR